MRDDMMEYMLFTRLAAEVKDNKNAALISLVKAEGSSPGKQGFLMAVFEDGSTIGTIGGGSFEKTVTEEALRCMEEGESKLLTYKLNDAGELHMKCGGSASVFIKVFKRKDKLLIAGGGHIANELYKFGKLAGFHVVVFEDREEYANSERFPECEIVLGDMEESFKKYPIDSSCYIVIVTRGHQSDEIVLRTVVRSSAAYIGMIGSRKKTKYVMERLEKDGYSKDELKRIYAPIGLALGGDSPSEIALSIISEIMMVKNGGALKHMKDIE